MTWGSNHSRRTEIGEFERVDEAAQRRAVEDVAGPIGRLERAVQDLHDVIGSDREGRIRRLAVGVRPAAPRQPVEPGLADAAGLAVSVASTGSGATAKRAGPALPRRCSGRQRAGEPGDPRPARRAVRRLVHPAAGTGPLLEGAEVGRRDAGRGGRRSGRDGPVPSAYGAARGRGHGQQERDHGHPEGTASMHPGSPQSSLSTTTLCPPTGRANRIPRRGRPQHGAVRAGTGHRSRRVTGPGRRARSGGRRGGAGWRPSSSPTRGHRRPRPSNRRAIGERGGRIPARHDRHGRPRVRAQDGSDDPPVAPARGAGQRWPVTGGRHQQPVDGDVRAGPDGDRDRVEVGRDRGHQPGHGRLAALQRIVEGDAQIGSDEPLEIGAPDQRDGSQARRPGARPRRSPRRRRSAPAAPSPSRVRSTHGSRR